MDEQSAQHAQQWLAERFESHRDHLHAVALRMLGSPVEADDAVQEAWLRASRADTRGDTAAVDNMGGWLTTVVARVSLDMLRSRRSRREESFDADVFDGAVDADPLPETLLAESMGPALLVVLDTLSPAERLAFVLHDLFGVSFDEIASIMERTPAAARQLASRARRRVRGVPNDSDGPHADRGRADRERQRAVVTAFLAASRDGQFDALLALLAPDAVLRADAAAIAMGATPEVRGASGVAGTFAGRAQGARLAMVDGAVGAVWSAGGRPRVVFAFAVDGGRVTAIELIADPARLERMRLQVLARP